MDIEQEYNRIIEEFDVFACYPRIKKRKAAEKLIVSWIREHSNCDRVICIGTDAEDIQNIKFIAERENVRYQYVLCVDGNIGELEKISWSAVDCVFLISLHREIQVGRWLIEHEIYYESLYDFFSVNSLYLEDEYYRLNYEDMPASADKALMAHMQAKENWRNNVFAELLYQKEKYKNETEYAWKKLFLERQFVLAVYMKNFILAKEILCEAEKNHIFIEEKYLKAWEQLQRLLDRIRELLQKREKEDCILVWMDALGYGDGDDMSYLQSQIAEGINFTNAFTTITNTTPTLRTIVNAREEIDNRGYRETEINEENKLFSYLKKQGYGIKLISGAMMSTWHVKLVTDIKHDPFAPCSEILWDMWNNLLLSQDKIFILVHLMCETHEPHFSTKLEYSGTIDGYQKGRLEIDEQMNFYLSGLNKNIIKIFFSDHGQWPMNTIRRWNTYLVVSSRYMKHRDINGMFSLIDFYKLIEQLIEKKDIQEDQLERDYVKIQCMDHYDFRVIRYIINQKARLEMELFGYRGVIDHKYIYLHYNTGKEYLAERDKMIYAPHLQPEADDVCDKTLLPYYRKLAGENPEGFYEDEKFKYSKYSYALYENFLKYKNPAFDLLNQLVGQYEDHSIAIRPGGAHSAELFFWLTEVNKKKIYCFIDNNPECLCSKLDNAKILPLDKVFEHREVKAVLLSSYYNLPVLKKEAENYPPEIEILDIYEYFAQHGCKMEHDFFDAYMDDAGYDVGFPMDE